jgi:hypothetical protein
MFFRSQTTCLISDQVVNQDDLRRCKDCSKEMRFPSGRRQGIVCFSLLKAIWNYNVERIRRRVFPTAPALTSTRSAPTAIWAGAVALLACALVAVACQADTSIVISVDPQEHRTLEWLKQHELCDYIDVKPTVTEAEIAAFIDAGWKVSLQMMGHPESFHRQYHIRRQQDFTVEEVLDKFLRTCQGRPQDFVWQILMEEDSAGVAFPQQLLREKPRTHAAAYELFMRRLTGAMAVAKPYPGVRLWGRAGFASSMHPFASLGLEMIILERTNDDIDDLSTGHAFARGAGRQYGCKWGIDFSQWWTAIAGCDLENSASYFRRNLYLSYFAGADSLGIELLGPMPEDDPKSATALSDALLEFGRFKKIHPQGRPIVPVAVLLARDHGWISPAYWHSQFRAWNYARIPYRAGDQSLDGIFAAAFPGSTYAMQPFPFGAYEDADGATTFSLSSVTAPYAPHADDVWLAPAPIPFGEFRNADEARATLLRERRNSSDYRPMADSRWGDILDAVTEDVAAENLANYKIVIVAGHVTANDAVVGKLRHYVEQGGILVWAAGVARPEHYDFTQCRLTPRLKQGRAWQWGGGPPQPEAFLYVPATVINPEKNAILARTTSGEPLVVDACCGRGHVMTCLLPWLNSEHRPVADIALRLLDELIEKFKPVSIEGLPVQYECSRDAEGLNVCIANHADVPWSGKVRVRELGLVLDECVELRSGKRLPAQRIKGCAEALVNIDRYDVVVLHWKSAD